MKDFRTVVTAAPFPFRINHTHPLLSIGSCFSENIGKLFGQYKFNIGINPFGQQYNPLSIAQGIERLLTATPYTETDLVHHNEQYHSFHHHSRFSGTNAGATVQHINQQLQQGSQLLKSCKVLFLTYGTAHAFTLKETGETVSNCHQFAAAHFNPVLLSPESIAECTRTALQKLRTVNPDVAVVFTVSPVRYFAFGHFENSVSKGHLFTAINQLLQQVPNTHYFAAYEMVVDDLRDYRFYADDMLHPHPIAIQYVWQQLANSTFSAETQQLIRDVEEITRMANHRPRNPGSEAQKKLAEKCLQKIEQLKQQGLSGFEEEEAAFKKYID